MRHTEEIVVTWNRGWTIFMICCCSVVGALALSMTLSAWPDRQGLFAVTATLALLMIASVRKGIRMYQFPPVLFRANREKVVTYLFGNNYRKQGFSIFWRDIDKVELVERGCLGAANDRVRRVTVALHLKPEVSVPAEISLVRGDEAVVHLDAGSGSLRGKELLTALNRLRVSTLDRGGDAD